MKKAEDDGLNKSASDYLAGSLNLDTGDLAGVLEQILRDAYVAGGLGADQATGGLLPSLTGIDWGAWTPGWGGAAAALNDPGLSAVLDRIGLTIQGLEDTTIDQLGGVLADGIRQGLSVDEIARQLRDYVDGDEDRAFLIADTEAARAMSDATMATYDQNGVSGKEWLVAEDPCPICQDNADAGPVAIDDSFPSGDDAPPAHPRCRCAVSPVNLETGEEESGDTMEEDSE